MKRIHNIFQKVLYGWRIAVKLLFFFLFGLRSVVLAVIVFPVLFLFTFFSKDIFQKISRKLVSVSFFVYIWEMRLLGIVTLHVEHQEKLKDIQSKVIVANHPSLLDVVMLISLLPNADCIVKASLGSKNIMRGVVNKLYIPNSTDFNTIIQRATESMDKGNCFIIFPEGTRTRPGLPLNLKKGAARIALASGRDIVPIYFGGNEKIGLRKYDKMLSFHPTERYHYNLEVLDTISIASYQNMPLFQATKLLTEKIMTIFTPI